LSPDLDQPISPPSPELPIEEVFIDAPQRGREVEVEDGMKKLNDRMVRLVNAYSSLNY